ncbi:hypothetical protein [Virgibacillus sp. DJP39]|uniref:hypothetical protein n=1 Tax=Virgibacillus sp. DJP39 TaxID=3409790 RepID=UPI003BB4D842
MSVTFSIRTEAPQVLNFLIYIQNIYLNLKFDRIEEYKFSYIPTREILFRQDIELGFEKLWNDVSQEVSLHPINGTKIFHEEKELFYKSLFKDRADSLKVYNEIYDTFKVWWNSLAGQFSIERSIGEKGKKLYTDLANSFKQKGNEDKKEINIYLIYEECRLGEVFATANFAVVSIREFYINYKELVAKLEEVIC